MNWGVAIISPQRRAFSQRVSDGLLAIYVLTGAYGFDGDRNVPVIRGRDHNGINVLAVEYPPMLDIIGCGRGVAHFRAQAVRLVYVTDAGNLRVFEFRDVAQQIVAASIGTDTRDPDALIGPMMRP